MKAVGQFVEGIAAYDAGKYTRKAMRVNERHALDEGTADEERIRYAARQAIGNQLVEQGSSGFHAASGSAADAIRESLVNRELDILTRRRGAQTQAQGFKQQGELAYRQGYAGMVGGMISGAATLAEQVASGGQGGAGGSGGGGYGRG